VAVGDLLGPVMYGIGVPCFLGLAKALRDPELQVREGGNGDPHTCLLSCVLCERTRPLIAWDASMSLDPSDGH
jgi:hypothetical protein